MQTEELAAIGETSVEFKDGSGHLVGMDVFHQLHCLNYLRKKLDGYKEGYPEIPEDEQIPPRYHIGKSPSHNFGNHATFLDCSPSSRFRLIILDYLLTLSSSALYRLYSNVTRVPFRSLPHYSKVG